MRQSSVFLSGEGRNWLDRNKAKLSKTTPESDPIIQAIEQYGLGFKNVLEIGCADGWRLKIIQDDYDCHVEGVDPGTVPGIPTKVQVWNGTADNLFYCQTARYNLVIYGWCLYLCDPEDYFNIAMEGDRVLADGGFLIVYDFYSPFAYKTPYKHKEGLFSYHYDFSRLWLSHPAYTVYGKTIQDETCVTILKKRMETAFPEER